jgi:anti-sigma B factor antagonist
VNDGEPGTSAPRPDAGNLMRVRHDVRDGAAVVHVAGEVDLVTAPRLVDELISVGEQFAALRAVVVDLSDVTFFASAGLQALVEQQQRCRDAKVDMYVVADRTVARTIDMTGLGDVLTVRASLAEALEKSSSR